MEDPTSSPPRSPASSLPSPVNSAPSSPFVPASSPIAEPTSSPVREPISSPLRRSRSSSPLPDETVCEKRRKTYETFEPVVDSTKYWPSQEENNSANVQGDDTWTDTWTDTWDEFNQDVDHPEHIQYVLTSSSEEASSSSSSGEEAESCESSSEAESIKSSIQSDGESSENDLSDSDESDSGVTSPKVYQGCSLTVDEGVLTMMDLFVKHKMEKVQIGGVLKSVLKFLPKIHNMPQTQYSLFKYVSDLCPLSEETIHYYCSTCQFYLGTIEKSCTLCNDEAHKFFQLSLSDQIRNLFENHGLSDIVDKYAAQRQELGVNENIVSDLCDGSEFKRAKIDMPYSLTLLGHTDGVSTSDSSDASLWPLEYVISEVPPNLRYKFVLVNGIWVDERKPYLNTFMKPFVKEVHDINNNGGVKWVHPKTKEECSSYVSVPCFAADAPARAGLQNILSHGGKYCCNICEQKMKKLPEEPVLPGERKKSRRRVFTFEEEVSKIRTAERMYVQGREARNKQQVEANIEAVRGVRGVSIAAKLPGCDRSTMVYPEYMHLLLCLIKEFLGLWFEKIGPWSLKDHLDMVNSFLANIRVPDFVTRIPRSIDCYHKWKANELRSFLLYFSLIVLRRCMTEEYFQHWLLLVYSLYVLLQDTVSPKDISRAEVMLQLFCRDFARLYKADHFTYYVHNLLHMPLVVKRLGPLWSNSTFQFESFNGTFSKLIHGTKHQGQELVNNVRLTFGVEVLKARVNDSHSSENMLSAVEFRNKVKSYRFTEGEELLLVSHNIDKTSVQLYFRAVTKHQIFTTSIYARQRKRNNFTVCFFNSIGEKVYGEIKLFLESDNVKMALLESFRVNHLRGFYHTESGLAIKHIIPIEKSGDIILVEVGRILHKVIKVENFICLRPNKYEVNL